MTHEVVITRQGAPAILDRTTGEVMHPIVGPAVEAQRGYLAPSRLAERLRQGPVTLFDVGLGGGGLAIAAWRCAAEVAGARLTIVSFDRTRDALALALEHAEDFALEGDVGHAARAILQHARHEGAYVSWRYVEGELPATLEGRADVIFWDAFSPKRNPELWSVAAFTRARAVASECCTLHTYSGATSTRAALLLAGFVVGEGVSTGGGRNSTVAAVPPAEVAHPLDARWLERLRRSTAPLPADAPADAIDRIAALPQLARVSCAR